MNKLKKWIQLLRLLMILPGVEWKNERFSKDFARWKSILCKGKSDRAALADLMWSAPEFRNLLIYRHSHRPLFRCWVAFWYRPMSTLFIQTAEIGGGLFIQHGFSTMISAKSIGENCWINQQVTIGYNGNGDPPVIGDNVMITCGAKVLGDIHIGNNVTVGANAVVIRDVESDVVVAGVPAKVVKYRKKVE